MKRTVLILTTAALPALWGLACESDDGGDDNQDTGTTTDDTGGDTDADGGTDTGADTDTDTYPDSVYNGSYFVYDNEDIAFLQPYTGITGSLQVYVVTDIDLPNLEFIGSKLVILATEAPNLSHLTALQAVGLETEMGLAIQDNASLQQIDGLAALAQIGGKLSVVDNPALTQINGLSQLDSITGSLNISGNISLTTIDALTNLGSFGGTDLTITNNPLLPTCEAEALRDHLQSLGWSGEVTITGNDDTAICL